MNANETPRKTLKPPKGAVKKKRIIGRGLGSGRGRTSGRGHKGLKARNTIRPGFEGGQMPLIQRLPKVGFSSRKDEHSEQAISIDVLQATFKSGEVLTLEMLRKRGLVGKQVRRVKLIGGRKPMEGSIGFKVDPKETAITHSASVGVALGLPASRPGQGASAAPEKAGVEGEVER